MTSRGKAETQALIKNMEDQMNRLVQQLADLDQYKEEMEEEEYEESRRETLDQLREFGESLGKMREGDLSLVDHLNNMQLAIQAAVSEAFRTPEVIQMFANKQNSQLRMRLAELDRDMKIGKLSTESGNCSRTEVLLALKKLGDKLSSEEELFLKTSLSPSQFQAVQSIAGESKLSANASAHVKAATAK